MGGPGAPCRVLGCAFGCSLPCIDAGGGLLGCTFRRPTRALGCTLGSPIADGAFGVPTPPSSDIGMLTSIRGAVSSAVPVCAPPPHIRSQSRRPQKRGGGGGGDRHRSERTGDGAGGSQHPGEVPPLPEAQKGIGTLKIRPPPRPEPPHPIIYIGHPAPSSLWGLSSQPLLTHGVNSSPIGSDVQIGGGPRCPPTWGWPRCEDGGGAVCPPLW